MTSTAHPRSNPTSWRRIAHLNPPWNKRTEATQHLFFHNSLQIMSTLLNCELAHAKAWEASRTIVMKAQEHQPGPLLVLEAACDWKDFISQEKLLVLFPRDGSEWIIRCAPLTKGSFRNKIDLPQTWAGLTGKALEVASGVAGASFCHRNLFMAVATSKQSALALAQAALAQTP
ncbi:MAG: MYG1 family protein [Nitrosarchaeum sp.]|nr:MYG1 family protein [Nitrosarchaeum sp.]